MYKYHTRFEVKDIAMYYVVDVSRQCTLRAWLCTYNYFFFKLLLQFSALLTMAPTILSPVPTCLVLLYGHA